MYMGYNYTRKFGIMKKSDYQSGYIARKNPICYYDETKIHFKNLGMIEKDGMTN